MNEEEKIDRFARLVNARVRETQGSGRMSAAATTGGARDSAPDVERWPAEPGQVRGDAKDEETRILERRSEERFAVDSEYQSRPEVQKDMERLVAIRAARKAAAPVRSPEGAPTQEEYDKNRDDILRGEKIANADREIEEAKTRRAILDLDKE